MFLDGQFPGPSVPSFLREKRLKGEERNHSLQTHGERVSGQRHGPGFGRADVSDAQ